MTKTLGGMEILGEISSGGMGEVLLAKRLGAHGFEKLVAIKTIRSELAERDDIRDLFLDEARLVARIEHPSVGQVHDFGEEDGTLFLAMEYVQGISLDALLEKKGPLPPAIAAQIAQLACKGLHAAHELTDPGGRSLGVVHRDISPSNLMLTFDGSVKIVDFGIALMRDRRAPATQVGRLRGKIAYMAPEQLVGEAVDRRTDVWGVANVLFELLTGKRLRGNLELHQIAEALDLSPPRLSALVPNLPPSLEEVVRSGLSRNPAERPKSAREMAKILEEIALELGGPTLEAWVTRELADEREEHQLRLSALLFGGQAPAKPTRGPTLVASGATPPPKLEPTRVPSKRRPVQWVAIAGAAIGLSAALLVRAKPATPAIAPPPQPVAVAREEEPPPEVVRAQPDLPRAPRAKKHPRHSPPAPIAWGNLTVGAHPYALVLIDGEDRGLTPLLNVRISAGSHEVRLLDPATRSLREVRKVEIHDGQHERLTFR